jgi:hypothetical protein
MLRPRVALDNAESCGLAIPWGARRRCGGLLAGLHGRFACGFARGAAPGRDRTAIEQARLIAEAVPARPALAREQLEIRARQQALDAPVRLLRLAAYSRMRMRVYGGLSPVHLLHDGSQEWPQPFLEGMRGVHCLCSLWKKVNDAEG